MPGFVGFPELLLLGVVVLLVFGPKRLPEMGRSMGKGLREFKDSISGDDKRESDDGKAPAVALEGDPLEQKQESKQDERQAA